VYNLFLRCPARGLLERGSREVREVSESIQGVLREF